MIFLAMLLGNREGKIEVATVFPVCNKKELIYSLKCLLLALAISPLFQGFLGRRLANRVRGASAQREPGSASRGPGPVRLLREGP